ncbi:MULTISPECIES: hypothetical protein [unclassified Sphingomonas]|uniref:hypothetical protein n=1 Tax=Novosphingobium rhizosphaerae TaxID=1551649 RepID=UPI0015CD6327
MALGRDDDLIIRGSLIRRGSLRQCLVASTDRYQDCSRTRQASYTRILTWQKSNSSIAHQHYTTPHFNDLMVSIFCERWIFISAYLPGFLPWRSDCRSVAADKPDGYCILGTAVLPLSPPWAARRAPVVAATDPPLRARAPVRRVQAGLSAHIARETLPSAGVELAA